ncbi:IS3 family transposase [Anaerosolibacter sp.]|uniref:IS3 family transposase n=1 Tax=Anaerosolibacter sp. TaxID=1872527 RepID=UPI0039EFD23B
MLENEILNTEIRKIFEEHKSRYESIRISKTLEQRDITANPKRVAKLMRNMTLILKVTRYKRYNQESSSAERTNLLKQSFQTDGKTRFRWRHYICTYKEGLIVHTNQGS